jgi:hypothetical protein
MRRIFALLSLFVISGCAGQLSGNYQGADAGHLVMSLAARIDTKYTSYDWSFRRKDHSSDSLIRWQQRGVFGLTEPEIKDDLETGIVEVRRLPPGEYEIYNFKIARITGVLDSYWSSRQDFSIPFTIFPGKATYIGEFMAVKIPGTNLFGQEVGDGGYFILSSKAERDLALARQKQPGLGEVVTTIVNPASIGNPLITDGPRKSASQ